MNNHMRQRNQRLGLEHSTSPGAIAAHTGFIEVWVLYGILSVAPGLASATAAALATTITSIATVAVVTGLQYLFMPKPPKPEDGKVPLRQAIPPRIYIMGTALVAGYYMLHDAGETGDYRRYLFMQQALAGHPCSQFRRLRLGDDWVEVDGDGKVVTVEGIEPDDARYQQTAVYIKTRLGAVPETAHSDAVSAFATSGLYTADHRLDGQTSAMIRCKPVSQEDFTLFYPGGVPKFSAELDGTLAWDFRDEYQDPDDPDTWEFTRNPILLMAWWTCFSPFGPRRDYTKVIIPVLDMWVEEADVCDELVATKAGGTQKRYEMGGWGTTETDPVGTENAILASCDGWRCWRGDGALLIIAGKFREKYVATLTDEDIVGHILKSNVSDEEEINRLVPVFTYPETGYTTTDTDFFQDDDAVQNAGRVLSRNANFQWVQDWQQARRLGYREWKRIQEKTFGTIDVRLSGINSVYTRWSRLETPLRIPRLNGKIIENRRSILSLTRGGYQMEFRRHPDDIETYVAATDAGTQPPIPPRPAKTTIPDVTFDSVTAIVNSGSVALEVIIDTTTVPDADTYGLAVRYRIKDIGGSVPGAWVEQRFSGLVIDDDTITVQTSSVPNDEDLEVQAAYIGTRGARGAWAPAIPEEVETIVDPVAPDIVTGLDVVVTDGTATVSFTTPNNPSTKFRSYRVYRAPAATAFDPDDPDVVDVSGQRNTAPATAIAFVDDQVFPETGSYRWHVVTENHSGVQSAEVTSDAETAGYDEDAIAWFDALTDTPTASWRVKYSAFIAGLKTDSIFTLAKGIWLTKGYSEEAARRNLIDPAQVGTNNGATWASGGYTGNGSSTWVDLGVGPTDIGITQDDATYGVGISAGTNATNSDAAALAQDVTPGNVTCAIIPRTNAGVFGARVNRNGASTFGTNGAVIGNYIATRRGASDLEGYKGGTSTGTDNDASTTVNNAHLCLFKYVAYSDFTITWAYAGLGMSDAQAASLQARIDTFLA